MIIFTIGALILAITIGIVLICEWSYIELKLQEAENERDKKTDDL